MSGSLRLVANRTPRHKKHDHVDLVFADTTLRLRDPRRFGTVLWHEGRGVEKHPLIAVLGIEPLSPAFDGEWLYRVTRQRNTPIKPLLMDSHLVVESATSMPRALFRAGLPRRARQAGSVANVAGYLAAHPRDAAGIDAAGSSGVPRLRTIATAGIFGSFKSAGLWPRRPALSRLRNTDSCRCDRLAQPGLPHCPNCQR